MSGPAPLARPGPEALRTLPLHVLVRDWPETLAPIRAAGIDPAARGAEPMARILEEAGAGLLEALERALAWRPPAGS